MISFCILLLNAISINADHVITLCPTDKAPRSRYQIECLDCTSFPYRGPWQNYISMYRNLNTCTNQINPVVRSFCVRMFNNYIEEFMQTRRKQSEGDGIFADYFWRISDSTPELAMRYINSKWFRGKGYFENSDTSSRKVHFFIIAQCTTLFRPK